MGLGPMSTPCSRLCSVLTVLRAFPCRSRLGDADTAATMEEEVRGHARWGLLGLTQLSWLPSPGRQQRATLSKCASVCAREPRPRTQPPLCPRSTRACCCGACPWWAGTTATRTARRCRRCRTSMCRWTTSCGCRALATASSPASRCCAVSPGLGVCGSPAPRSPWAQPRSLSSGSPVLLWQPGPGVQDRTVLGDAAAGGRWRHRGAQGPARWGRAHGAQWPLLIWDGGLGWPVVTSWCPCQQRPSDYGIPMDVEMAYVQDSFLTNDILHEMVSTLLGGGVLRGERPARTQGARAECATPVALRMRPQVLPAAPPAPCARTCP